MKLSDNTLSGAADRPVKVNSKGCNYLLGRLLQEHLLKKGIVVGR